jgi:AcrR family transcriptional regulator
MATRSRTTRAAAPAASDTASAAVGAKAGTKASPEVRAATGTAVVARAVRAPRKTTVNAAHGAAEVARKAGDKESLKIPLKVPRKTTVKTVLPPVAPRTAATRDPERTSAAILAAAVKEFREHGYGGARIDAIAKRANINKRMLYHYFGDKDALYLAVLEGAYMQIRAAETRLHLADLDPVEGVRQLVLFTWRYYQEHPEFLSLLGTENLLKAKFLKRSARIFDLNSPLLSMLSDMLWRGEAAGQFRPDQDALDVYLSIAGMNFFYLSNRHTLTATFRRDLGAKEELARWGEHVADVILAFLKA